MPLESATALAVATIILGLSPGPAVFATIGRALNLGLRSTYLFIAGIIAGDLLFSLMAMLGLAVLAQKFAVLFIALKIIGGGYLVYLGIQSWRASSKIDVSVAVKENGWKLVTSGFLLTASNPKDLLFFVGFLPLFVDLKDGSFGEFFTASVVIVLSFLATLSFYAIAAHAVRGWFKNEKPVRILNKIAGTLMIGAGFVVIFL